MAALPFPGWYDANGRLRHEVALPIPCRCLRWAEDPASHPSGATETWQVLPDCILHRRMLSPEVLAWLDAEVTAAKHAEAIDQALERRPWLSWRSILTDRLKLAAARRWDERIPQHPRHRREATFA